MVAIDVLRISNRGVPAVGEAITRAADVNEVDRSAVGSLDP